MPDLAALVEPGHTAVVTSELQRGVVGEHAVFPELARVVADRGTVAAAAELCGAARQTGVPVIHGCAVRRADGRGANANARLFAAAARADVDLREGSEAAELVDAVGPGPGDLVLTRLHGLNPMARTELDPLLRNLGVTTIVVAGVSVNVAVTNLVMDAVNAGYRVVLPTDAVAGVPADYADAVVATTLAVLAELTTTADVADVWATQRP